MASEPTLAQRFYLVGRMLQVQPDPELLETYQRGQSPSIDSARYIYQRGQSPSIGFADAVHQDYLRLFVGLGMPLAPPWESAWASDARLLFGRQTLDVRYWYRSFGLQVAALHHEPDDHIGLELEFIGRLLELGEDEAARAFAAEHPLAWASRWAAAVQDAAATPFYPQLAAQAISLLDAL